MPTYSPLLTDQYQLVMAYSYWKLGLAEREAVFNLSFRKLPVQSSYILAAGLEKAIEFLINFRFQPSDIDYLSSLKNDTEPMFSDEFLEYLQNLTFICDLDAVCEGTLVFAKEPVLRITGPLLQCQLLETPLLNFINFASLIATKASQVYLATEGDMLIEFGLRRAQGPDGGLMASRSAYLGGCWATSNVLAGKLYDIPINGTQAHSWIMAFPSELEAFKSFAKVMKDKTVLLVDTYDTITGIEHAIEVGLMLKTQGYPLAGIRLDSGNLLELSRKARHLLDRAGLTDTKIIASGDLDDHIIRNLKINDAPIDAWGVGTRLVTSYDQPALNAIYKLTALRNEKGKWLYKMKISNDIQKSTLPGILQVQRFYRDSIPISDMIYDIELPEEIPLEQFDEKKELLQPIFRKGKLVFTSPNIHDVRQTALNNVNTFMMESPKPYTVTMGARFSMNMEKLIKKLKPL